MTKVHRAAVGRLKYAHKGNKGALQAGSLGSAQEGKKRAVPFTHLRSSHKHGWLKGFTHSVCSVCGETIPHGLELPEYK